MKIGTKEKKMRQSRIEEDIESDIYGEDSREELVDDDQLSPEEAGFMQGYMDS